MTVVTEEAILSVENVNLSFEGIIALSDVSFALAPGETVGLAGPNGAGKTSLLNCLTGIYRADSGNIWFAGHAIERMGGDRISRLGMARTVQHAEGFRRVGCAEVMMLGLHDLLPRGVLKYGFPFPSVRRQEKNARDRVLEVGRQLGIEQYVRENARVDTLPYGTRKLADIGRALVRAPQMLLYDEPAAGLSSDEKRKSADVISGIQRDHGVTQVVVDHDIDFLGAVCDRIIVLSAGVVIAEGTPEEIWRSDEVIRSYIGGSA
jgi:branched-chain amino acid transport system ATP-binding protein